jgi:hypothetical protein
MSAVNIKLQSEKDLRYIKMTMAMEDMPLTARDIEDVRDCLTGKTSADDIIKQLVAQYTVEVTE